MVSYSGIMNCVRCGKGIPHPDSSNADYIMAPDTVVREPRELFFALKHNQATLAKAEKMKEVNPDGTPKYPDLAIADNEYEAVEVPNIEAARAFGEDLAKVIFEVRERDTQKTGIICPSCYKPTDIVIWGVHK